MKKKRFLLLMIMFITNFLIVTNVSAAVGEWIGDYCDSCGTYGTAGKCDQVKYTNVGLFRVTFYLNGEKIGSSVNVSSNETYKDLAKNAKWHWGDGKTDIVSYASGQTLGTPVSGGLDTIVINGINVSNVQNKLSPSKNSKNVQKILTEAGITKFKFKNGKIYYTPDDGVCEEDYQIQMVVESMQVINWLCTTDGLDNHRWIGTPYELNNGLLQQGYDSHVGGNGYMSGSIVDKTLLSSLRIDKDVKIGNVAFTSVDDCLKIHIRGYKPTEGYGFNVYDLTGEIKIDCEPECCVPCNTSNPNLITAINSGKFACDPNNCDGEDEIATDIDSEGKLVCEPYIPDDCCNPTIEDCCEIGTKLCGGGIVTKSYYDKYCTSTCEYQIDPPTATTGVCTTEKLHSESKFTDGHFSENYWVYLNLFYQNKGAIYQEEMSSTYCETYCQEKTIIELPENYPYVNAGRYFTWTIADSKDSLIKETVYKNCATNIELDKWRKDYKNALDDINGNFYYVKNDTSPSGIENRAYELIDAYNKCMGDASSPSDEQKQAYRDGLNIDDIRDGVIQDINDWNSNLQNAKDDYGDGSYGSHWDNDFGCDAHHPGCFNDMSPKPTDDASIDAATEEKINEMFKQSRESVCITMFSDGTRRLTILANARGDSISIDAKSRNVTYIEKSLEPTLHNLISQLKNCQYEDNPEDGPELSLSEYFEKYLSNLNSTDLKLNLNYQTYLSEREYSNDDMIKNSNIIEPSKNGGCNQKDKNKCNPKDIFESNVCENKIIKANSNDGEGINEYGIGFIPSVLGEDSVYSKKQDISGNWKSYVFLKTTSENDFKLKNNINACICKDGTIIDAAEDGSCECPDMNSVTEIIADISDQYSCYFEWKTTYYYTTVEDGNLSVEYMTPTGLYPLQLDYSNIGTNNGHFSNFMRNGILGSVPHCQGGVCHYSDEDGKCYFIVNNEVITDGGKIYDNICPNGNCGDDDKCTEGDCSNYCEVGHCSNDSSIGGMEIIYRQVDLNNPFPDREAGKNWQGHESIITLNREVEGSNLYSSKLEPVYSITMTPATIKEIRKVNEALNYDYSSIGTMIFDKEKITGGVSYILRGSLKNIAESTGGTFTINLNDANTDGRFDEIMNNPSIDSSGNLTTCREIASEVIG